MQKLPISVLLILLMATCVREKRGAPQADPVLPLAEGTWRMSFDLGDVDLPVNLVVRNESGLKVDVNNAEEVITIYEFDELGDSLRLRMPLFDSEFLGVVSKDRRQYSGIWKNYSRSNGYAIPFVAEHGLSYRFCETNSSVPPMKFPSRFKVDFSPGNEEDHYPAIGLFQRSPNSNRITGTFATETGDYRYLEGNFCDGKLLLSCFDGSHAFYFSADYDQGNLINGLFKSGTHWEEPWLGEANDEFELNDPMSLTYITDSSAVWKTAFLNGSGDRLTLKDLGIENKVAIIQVLGTWCPNCMDESRSYVELYKRFHDRGLEIIPIAFENTEDPAKAHEILEEYRKDLLIPYPIYFGGKRSKKTASEALPCINQIMSYPTSIIIGRDAKVKIVHTGFYGPGTGVYYDNWLHNMEVLLDSLLSQS